MPRERIDTLPRREREIGPEKQALRSGKLQQQVELVLVGAQSGVVVEVLAVPRHLLGRVSGQASVREGGGHACDEVGKVAAGVGEDDFDARGEGAEDGGGGHEEINGSAAGFVAVVEYRLVGSVVDYSSIGGRHTIGRCGLTRLVSTVCVGWTNTIA